MSKLKVKEYQKYKKTSELNNVEIKILQAIGTCNAKKIDRPLIMAQLIYKRIKNLISNIKK